MNAKHIVEVALIVLLPLLIAVPASGVFRAWVALVVLAIRYAARRVPMRRETPPDPPTNT